MAVDFLAFVGLSAFLFSLWNTVDMKMKLIGLLFAGLLLSGCLSAPPQKEIANADFGKYPSNYESTIEHYMRQFLKDPDSVKYEYVIYPRKSWYVGGLLGPSGTSYGYAVCAKINAKNSFGGYTGSKIHYFLIKNDRIIAHFYDSGRRYDIGRSTAYKACGLS